jgi:outer membrane protein OmpA-like peptidoglycan-associated protein
MTWDLKFVSVKGMAHRALWCVLMSLSLLLLACQTQIPHKGLTVVQQQALRSQGFSEGEQGWELQMSGKLLFEFDSADVGASAQTKIMQLGQALKKEGIDRLRVEGYTDERGSDAYNLRLSLRRAQAVADILVQAGMPKQSVEVKGMGNSLPVVSGNAAENRRVAIVIPFF